MHAIGPIKPCRCRIARHKHDILWCKVAHPFMGGLISAIPGRDSTVFML